MSLDVQSWWQIIGGVTAQQGSRGCTRLEAIDSSQRSSNIKLAV